MNAIMSISVMYEHQAIYGYECKEGQTNQGAARLPGGEYPAIILNSGTCPALVQEVAVAPTILRRVNSMQKSVVILMSSSTVTS